MALKAGVVLVDRDVQVLVGHLTVDRHAVGRFLLVGRHRRLTG
jgi:hypothetical protein